MSHDEKHEEILRGLAVGDLSPDSVRARELFAACAPCRESWDALRRVRARLASEDAERRAILADAQSIQAAATEASEAEASETEERTERALRAEIARAGPGDLRGVRRARSPWPARWLAAAALLVVVGLVYRASLRRDPRDAPDVVLGAQIENLRPVGAVASYAGIVFAWEQELSAEGWFALRLEGRAGAGAAWQSLAGPPARLRAGRLEPESSVTERWPDQLRWRVIAYDVAGNVLGDSAWQSLWRAP